MKIIVRGTNWIGDAVMSIPALRELRRIFPDSHITLHMRSWADALFRDSDLIDELVTFDKHRWAIKDVYDNSQFLKDDRFDLAVLFPNSFESALTSFMTRVPRRFGYNKDVRGLLLTDPIAVPEWKNRRHEVFYYMHLVGEVEKRILDRDTVSQTMPDTSLQISDERRQAARSRLGSLGVDPTKKLVVLGAGSANSRAKRWPVEQFSELNDRLRKELNTATVLLGSKDDRSVTDQLVSLSKMTLIDLAGKTELDEAAAILAVADLMITNDMGLAHLAPAVGAPTIVLFGPTDPETTRPYSKNAVIIRKDVECSPCMYRDCPIDHRCMTRISVDEVFTLAAGVLAEDEEESEEAAGGIR
jgi:heptosyltransferase-2